MGEPPETMVLAGLSTKYIVKEESLMLRRLWKKCKEEKGFTLVELLAVIVILGIIAAIAVPAIGGIIGNTEDKADEAEIDMIIEAARIAYAAEEFETEITVADLVTKNYLEEKDGTELPTGKVVYKSNPGADEQNFEFTPTTTTTE